MLALLAAVAILAGSLVISQPRSFVSESSRVGRCVPILLTGNDASPGKGQNDNLAASKKHEKKKGHAGKGHKPPINLDDAVALLKRIHPQLANQIEKLRKKDPKQAQAMLLKHYYHGVKWLLRLKARDSKAYQLRVDDICYTRKSHGLADQILKIVGKNDGKPKTAANDPKSSQKASKLKGHLYSVLEEQFDVRQALRAHELNQLQDQIQRMKQQMASLANNKDQVIQQRMDQLLRIRAKKVQKKQNHAKKDAGKQDQHNKHD